MGNKEQKPIVAQDITFTYGGTTEENLEIAADHMEETADALSLFHNAEIEGEMIDPSTGEIVGRCWTDPDTARAKANAKQFSMPYREGQYEKIFDKVGKA